MKEKALSENWIYQCKIVNKNKMFKHKLTVDIKILETKQTQN